MKSYQELTAVLNAAGIYRNDERCLLRAYRVYALLAHFPEGLTGIEIRAYDPLIADDFLDWASTVSSMRRRVISEATYLAGATELRRATTDTLSKLQKVGLVRSTGNTRARRHRVV